MGATFFKTMGNGHLSKHVHVRFGHLERTSTLTSKLVVVAEETSNTFLHGAQDKIKPFLMNS